MEDYAFLFKIVLIGNAGVGKTCLVRRYIQGEFPRGQGATIGVDFMIKPMVVKDIKVNLQLWDTAGQERFRSITQSYYRSAHCLVLVYDISAQHSFDSLNQWCRDMEQFTGSASIGGSSNNVLRILVGNKCDKDREIPYHIGEQFANNHRFEMFIETSALQLDNVNHLFNEIAERLVERRLAQISAEKTIGARTASAASLATTATGENVGGFNGGHLSINNQSNGFDQNNRPFMLGQSNSNSHNSNNENGNGTGRRSIGQSSKDLLNRYCCQSQ